MQSLWMVVAAMFLSLYGVCVKYAGIEGIGSWEMLFFRSIFGVVVFYILMRMKGQGPATKYPWAHMTRSLAGTFAILAGMYAISHLNLGLAQTLNYTSPLFVGSWVAFSSMLHHDRVNWGLMLMVIIGFIGVIILLGPTISPSEYYASAVGLAGGFLIAVATTYVKKLGSYKEPEARIIFYLVLVGSVCGLAGTLVTGGFHSWTTKAALFILGLCVFSTLGQLTLTMAFSRGNLVLSSSLQYTVILFSTIFGEVIFNEPVTLPIVTGMIVIVVAGILSSYFVRKENKAKQKASVQPKTA